MQEGIGRSGYRLIALVFAALGALGLASLYVALRPTEWYQWLGYGLVIVALVALLVVVMRVLSIRPQAGGRAAPAGVVEPEPGLLPTPVPADPAADLGVEYDDFDVEPVAVADGAMAMAPPEQPRAPMVVPPRKPQGDTKGWPKRPEPSGVTRGELRKREKEQPQFESPREPPLVMARTAASAEASGIPDNVSLGKCGNCGVLLLAPKRRPVRLQCPRCERVHTMT
jgi:hypothetical protein